MYKNINKPYIHHHTIIIITTSHLHHHPSSSTLILRKREIKEQLLIFITQILKTRLQYQTILTREIVITLEKSLFFFYIFHNCNGSFAKKKIFNRPKSLTLESLYIKNETFLHHSWKIAHLIIMIMVMSLKILLNHFPLFWATKKKW